MERLRLQELRKEWQPTLHQVPSSCILEWEIFHIGVIYVSLLLSMKLDGSHSHMRKESGRWGENGRLGMKC